MSRPRSPLDDKFFDRIDTEEKAYWLGFIYTDGCLTPTSVILALQLRDMPHLHKFKKVVGSTLEPHVYTRTGTNRFDYQLRQHVKEPERTYTYCHFAVHSKEMVEDLQGWGVIRKNRQAPLLEPAMEPFFWRGVIDGDGHITLPSAGNPYGYRITLTGNTNTCGAFARWIERQSGFRPTIRKTLLSNIVSVGGLHKASALLRLLYKDSCVSLDRKQERADAILKISDERPADFYKEIARRAVMARWAKAQ